jgi:hypothetical protein
VTFEDTPLRYFNPKVIASKKLAGLIYGIAQDSGLDHVTSLGKPALLKAIDQPYLESITIEFEKHRSGWILRNLETRRSYAGAPTIKRHNGS